MIAIIAATVLLAPQADFPLTALGIGSVRTVGGKSIKITPPDKKGTVLFFITVDCPIANRFAPEIARIAKAYAPKGFVFLRVYAENTIAPADTIRHGKDFGLSAIPAVIDAQHYLVKKIRPKVTPEAAVVGPDGRLLYRGRIDDSYMDHGRYNDEPTRRDLREALKDVLAGRAVRLKNMPAVGCDIPDLR
jgi:hypothetical protein